MKTKSKALLLALCAVLLVAASVLGTLAYLTDTETVTNTFTVGEDVTIKLDEAKTDENGVVVTPEERVTGNEYKLLPGHTYAKDPTVHVTGEDCYVFVTVTNGISNIEATGDTTIAAQMAKNGWVAVDGYTDLYIYNVSENADKTVVAKTTDLVVFETFTVKDDAVHNDLNDVKNSQIVINAYAVQKDGFENKTPADIWATVFTTQEG